MPNRAVNGHGRQGCCWILLVLESDIGLLREIEGHIAVLPECFTWLE